jgi:hypothetical protein
VIRLIELGLQHVLSKHVCKMATVRAEACHLETNAHRCGFSHAVFLWETGVEELGPISGAWGAILEEVQQVSPFGDYPLCIHVFVHVIFRVVAKRSGFLSNGRWHRWCSCRLRFLRGWGGDQREQASRKGRRDGSS